MASVKPEWLDDFGRLSFVKRYEQKLVQYLRVFQTPHTDVPTRWAIWHPLVVILCLAVLLRVGHMLQPGFDSDLIWNAKRAVAVYHGGLFNLYRVIPSDYPPIYLSMLGIVGAF